MPKVYYLRSRRIHWTQGHPALKAFPCGHVEAKAFGKAREWEEWTVQFPFPDKPFVVGFQSHFGKFLSARPDGSVHAHANKLDKWEQWTIEEVRDGYVALRSFHGKYLVCDNLLDCGKKVRADRSRVQEWEEWAIVSDPRAGSRSHGAAAHMFGVGLLVVGALVGLVAMAIPALGFGQEGVAAGSIAAAAQSIMYGAETGGAFAVLQSIGATAAWAPVAIAGTAAARVGAQLLSNGEDNESLQLARLELGS